MTINVGILGFAHGHVNNYCREWKQNPAHDIRLVAGWDHNAARLAQAVENYGIHACTTPDELLSRADVQAVVIATETSLHASLAEKAAAAGKIVAVQKPIALTLPEADRVVAAVERYGVPFTIAWQMRVDPQNLKMKEVIQSGILGKVFMVRRRHALSTQLPGIPAWHFVAEYNRDIWADDACHPIDFVHWLLGVPESVMAELVTLYDPQKPMDNGIALYRYADDTLAEVSCSFTCLTAENTTEIIAEKGTIIQSYGDGPSSSAPRPAGIPGLKWYTLDKKDWTHSDIASPTNQGVRISGLSGPLAEFFHGRRPPIATAEEGRTSLRMVLATYVSTREGRRVRLDDPAIALV